MQRSGLASSLLLIVCLVASRATAEATPSGAQGTEAEARAAFERGRNLYDHGSFVQAASAFEEAYRLSGRDALLYNIYLAHRDANQPEQAARALRDYLSRVENIENREQLEARLVALEQGLAREREAAAREPAKVEPEPAAPVSVESAPPPPPSGRSLPFIAGVSLAAVGGAMALGSIGTGLTARARESDLEDACPTRKDCSPSLRDDRDSGQRLARATDGLLFGGIAVAAAGGVLLIVDAKRGERAVAAQAGSARKLQFSAVCSRAGCGATAYVSF